MGSDPASSAFDPEGESWDVAGLFVCDTSAFPSATGANPMGESGTVREGHNASCGWMGT